MKYFLSGKGGKWSTWGVQHLEDSVIAKKPDAVFIEFAINDAHEKFKTSPNLAKLNLEYMIERIKLQYPSCEIILQIMNMMSLKTGNGKNPKNTGRTGTPGKEMPCGLLNLPLH